MTNIKFFTQYKVGILLTGILILSGFLNLWNIWNQGISNAYYAAAVRSMLENPALIFFNSFDAAGFVTVDKPPVGLWVQIASAALLGFSGWALVLPQALAGIGSVGLIYAIVSRPFGKPAGLVSAFTLAITPIFVAVSRNGTMDGLLIFVILLALWVAQKAARERSLPYLLLSVVLIGIGFNIKMIQAFIVVPAVLALYFLGTRDIPLKNRALHIGLAIMVLVGVSFSWAVAVDMIPADQRPYIGGSGDNTVAGLIVNYNGIHRLENGMGQGGITGGSPPGGIMPALQDGASFAPDSAQNRTSDRPMDMPATDSGSVPLNQGQGPPSDAGSSNGAGAGSQPGGGMGGGMDETGSPGIMRLFGQGLAGQISWLLPFALIGLLAWWRRPESLSIKGLEGTGFFGERGLTLLALCLWLFPGLLYFSFTTGFWHTYYLATIAPPLAALVGINAMAMYEAYRTEGMKSWLFIAAVPVTGIIQVLFLCYTAEWSGSLIPLILTGTITVTILLAALKLRKKNGTVNVAKTVTIVAITVLFVAPLAWACTPVFSVSGGILPVAGPQLLSGNTGAGTRNGSSGTEDGLSALTVFLTTHNTGETWIVAVPSSMDSTSLILETGAPVMALGGFSGSDQILSVDNLTNLISDGKVRYFLTRASSGGGGMSSGNNELFTWVSGHCTAVPSSEWNSDNTATAGQNRPFSVGNSNTSSPTGPDSTWGSGNTSPGQANQNSLYDCGEFRTQVST
jgi:4-amino-4-deoxy-L-arabinose transferase-like glycosyltransferase